MSRSRQRGDGSCSKKLGTRKVGPHDDWCDFLLTAFARDI